ncbi:MAG: radical SAM protein [Solirubrobacterales bacterium]|nr:radical SAM protein [Solirubrobacterales bacterium]
MSTLETSLEAGRLSPRVWFYANYHCNLRCSYCLTESAPGVPRRELGPQRMLALAREARDLGFSELGVTGGEPFLLDYLPELLGELARILPVVVLSNGTVFTARRLRALEPLAGLPLKVQISLDHPDPVDNDAMRGPENFARVVAVIPELIARGIAVRIATTLEDPDSVDPAEAERLCALHRSLGVPDADHIVRPIVRRGRADTGGMGLTASFEQLEPELTITSDGAFASPFGPTVRGGRMDTDLLVTRTISPLRLPAEALAGVVEGRPAGTDARLGIR